MAPGSISTGQMVAGGWRGGGGWEWGGGARTVGGRGAGLCTALRFHVEQNCARESACFFFWGGGCKFVHEGGRREWVGWTDGVGWVGEQRCVSIAGLHSEGQENQADEAPFTWAWAWARTD